MILTFAEDFTNSVTLDSELLSTPESGMFWNRGVHPMFTVDNLLTFLPKLEFTFSDYNASTTYNKFEDTLKRTDLVTYNDIIYQSISNNNLGNTPGESSANWLETNIESLRIKAFLYTVETNAISALSLNRKLIENQYIKNVGETVQTLPANYAGWVFEPKGSDYVKIRINQIGLQANTTTPQNLYIVNQGVLIDTLTLNPNNGKLVFEDVNYTIFGQGRFELLIDSQEVKSENAFNDPLRYNGFVCYPISGTGSTPETATITESSLGNGMNFNVTAYLDSEVYIDNNKIDLAKFFQSQFEYDVLRMISHNAHNRFGMKERIQANEQLIATEMLDLKGNTIAREYNKQKKIAIDAINATFDKFLHKKRGLKVKRKVN